MSLFETATYETIKKETNRIELRLYPTFYIAKTTVRLDDKFTNGFSNVFNYISGQNEESKKISMTTPVISTTSENLLTTGFVIPKKLKSSAPKPSNQNVEISEITNGHFLAIRFSGSWSKENFDKYDKLLKDFMTGKYKELSERYILRYQPPFVPSFLRRNEIMYRVEVL